MSSLEDVVPNAVLIRGDGPTVPISFIVGEDGFARVTGSHLASRFQIVKGTLHLDLDVVNPVSKQVSHTVAQMSCDSLGGEVWSLAPGNYRVYGFKDNPLDSKAKRSSATSQVIPMLQNVKLEHVHDPVLLLSDDSDSDCILSTPDFHAPDLVGPPVVHAPSNPESCPSRRSCASTSKPPLPPTESIVQCLR